MPLIAGRRGTGFSSLSSCLDRGLRDDLSFKIITMPIANYWKECCTGVCVALPLIVQITNMHYSSGIVHVDRAVGRELLSKENFKTNKKNDP